MVRAGRVDSRVRWGLAIVAPGFMAAACAISFPDYTLGSGGSSSSSTSTSSTSSTSSMGGGGSPSSTSTGSTMDSATSTTSGGLMCDGGAGQWPVTLPFTAHAFDVAADGAVVAVAVDQNAGNVQAICLNPDGSVAQPQFMVAGSSFDKSTYTMSDIDVARAASGEIAISWNYFDSNLNAENKVAFLTADCKDLAPTADVDDTSVVPFGIKRLAVARWVGQHFFFLYDAHSYGSIRLVSYDMMGTRTGMADVGTPPCASGGYGRALGVNASTGNVVVGCQDVTGKRYLRRYSSSLNPLDTAPVAISAVDAVGDAGAMTPNGYLIDYNDKGDLVFLADPNGGDWPVAVLNGTMVMTLGHIPGVSTLSNDRILSSPSGEIILPLQTVSSDFQGFQPDGAMGLSWNLDGSRFRVDGCNRVYALASLKITRQPAPW